MGAPRVGRRVGAYLAPHVSGSLLDIERVQFVVSEVLDAVQGGLQETQLFVVEFEPEVFGPVDIDPFNGQQRESSVSLEVLPIQVHFGNPGPFYLSPGEGTFLEVTVENAVDPSIEWSVVGGSDGVTVSPGGDGQYAAWVDAHEPGRYQIRAESASRSGARSDYDPPRFDIGFVHVGALTVTPSPGCIQDGSTHQFTVRMGGEVIDFDQLAWTIDGPGTMTDDGLYSAEEQGDVTITFYLEADPEQTDTVTFAVDDVCGSFTLESPEFSFSGSCVTFHTSGVPGTTGIQFGNKLSDSRHGSIVLQVDIDEAGETSGSEWTVTDPGWIWGSTIHLDFGAPLPWGFKSDESNGDHSITLSQETTGGERILSGSFHAVYTWLEETADGYEEQESVVQGSFTGARDADDELCWLTT